MGVALGQFDVKRDGGSSGQESPGPTDSQEKSLQAVKATPVTAPRTYSKAGNANGLIDVIA
jgi:hypothetical protein